MKLEDVDFEIALDNHKFRISELTIQDINQIKKISKAIRLEKIFTCPVKAILCAFQLYVEAIIETDEWLAKGKDHH